MTIEYTLCLEKTTLFGLLLLQRTSSHQLVLIIFGRSVAKKVISQMVLYIPTSSN